MIDSYYFFKMKKAVICPSYPEVGTTITFTKDYCIIPPTVAF